MPINLFYTIFGFVLWLRNILVSRSCNRTKCNAQRQNVDSCDYNNIFPHTFASYFMHYIFGNTEQQRMKKTHTYTSKYQNNSFSVFVFFIIMVQIFILRLKHSHIIIILYVFLFGSFFLFHLSGFCQFYTSGSKMKMFQFYKRQAAKANNMMCVHVFAYTYAQINSCNLHEFNTIL